MNNSNMLDSTKQSNGGKTLYDLSENGICHLYIYIIITEQEADHKVGLSETPRRLIWKRCRFSSLEKFEDDFDTALDLVQIKPTEAAFLDVFLNFEKCWPEAADDVISDVAED